MYMSHSFAEIAFTESVKTGQEELGSRSTYARMAGGLEKRNHRLTDAEAAFIAERDSFYMATVGETGWPYIQHRGGPRGFVRALDAGTIGFADYRGNRQYVSVGNLRTDDRVSLFFMDYARKARLKVLGRAQVIALEDAAMLARLKLPDDKARVERGLVIAVEAFDWNCPQHITERYTIEQVREATARLAERVAELEAELKHRRSGQQE
jgi:predicted pyridoxine 5'-phosphate oxidase superfamily flavin-nucleotide-binding protein